MLDELAIYNLSVKYPNTIDLVREVERIAKAEAIDEFWTEFDKQIKTQGRQAYYYTEFLVIGMKIREQMKEQNK